jgi:hypothetical protein
MKTKPSVHTRFCALCLFSAVLLGGAARAQFISKTNIDDTITITGYTGSDASIAIPSTISGRPVTENWPWLILAW